ncbi:MAG: hypothetical protein GTN73_03200 [Candidatus Aminicenantes bacterium]|nr:hypothetical protein [Candidatus Aminicenantes bacterium]
MTWTCPNCKKEFRNKNQVHSCAKVDLEDHLKNKSPQVIATFDKLMRELGKFGEITLNPVITSVQVRAGATFLSVKPKKECMEIEFQLSDEVNKLPIYKNIRISRNRVLHFAILKGPQEVNTQLINWLKKSYELVSK